MKKPIFELTGKDFLTGYSIQAGQPENGIFQNALGFDPFNKRGYLVPSLQPSALSDPTGAVKCINSWFESTTGYVLVQTASNLYRYAVDSPYGQTSYTSKMTITSPIAGAIVWADPSSGTLYYIYAQWSSDVKVFSNNLAASPTETQIMTNSPITSNNDIRPFCIGSDNNLYIGHTGYIGRITNPTTNDNDHSHFALDYGFTPRWIVSDGYYLVIMADNNHVTTTSRTVGNYKCKIYFWDKYKATADVIHTFSDSYIIGGAFLNDKVYVFGYNGIYVCNIVTSPKMIWDFRGNSTITNRPISPYQIVGGSDRIYWGDGNTSTGSDIFAIKDTTLYSPYITHSTTAGHAALELVGTSLFAATSTPKLYVHNVGSTAGNLTAQTATIRLDQPHTLDYVKVVLKSPMSSGQAVAVNMWDSNASVIMDTNTRSFSTNGAKKTLIFKATPSSNSKKRFNDFYLQVNPQSGVAIERVSVYATPMDDHLEE